MHKVNTSDNGGRNLECFNNSALMEISYRQKMFIHSLRRKNSEILVGKTKLKQKLKYDQNMKLTKMYLNSDQ